MVGPQLLAEDRGAEQNGADRNEEGDQHQVDRAGRGEGVGIPFLSFPFEDAATARTAFFNRPGEMM
jgi:hypothetical protein